MCYKILTNFYKKFTHYAGCEMKLLRFQKDLDKLTLYNRLNCCGKRARDLQVRVFGDLDETELLFDQQARNELRQRGFEAVHSQFDSASMAERTWQTLERFLDRA